MVLKSIFQLKALTEIWTANDDLRKGNILRETGLTSSLRWWYEALVRGLGGFACGAVDGGCGYEPGKKDESGREIPREKQICPVCELFGCTGWSRKFRLRILNSDGKPASVECRAGREFYLEFLWLKKPGAEESWLLDRSLRIAAEYGSIGGKTTLKPQAKVSAVKDYGLFKVLSEPDVSSSLEEAKKFLGTYKASTTNDPEYPDLRNFFFLKGSFLDKDQMNSFFEALPGTPLENEQERTIKAFMKGKVGDSKKIFSFRSGGERVWGYTRNDAELLVAMGALKAELGLNDIITGERVMTGEL